MKRLTIGAALVLAAAALPLSVVSTWADDAHHSAPGMTAQSPATPPTAAATDALSELSIRSLQEALAKQGITVKIDGVLSDKTREAIRQYQTQHHLPVTGEPDKATLEKLGVVHTQATAPRVHPGQGGMMMHCQKMNSGQSAQGGMMNCPMMSNQPGQTQGMGHGMMHGTGAEQKPETKGPSEAKPAQPQPEHEQHHPDAK